MAPPVPAPAIAPSGALVLFSWAKSRVVPLSGKRAEISLLEKFVEPRFYKITLTPDRNAGFHDTAHQRHRFVWIALQVLSAQDQ